MPYNLDSTPAGQCRPQDGSPLQRVAVSQTAFPAERRLHRSRSARDEADIGGGDPEQECEPPPRGSPPSDGRTWRERGRGGATGRGIPGQLASLSPAVLGSSSGSRIEVIRQLLPYMDIGRSRLVQRLRLPLMAKLQLRFPGVWWRDGHGNWSRPSFALLPRGQGRPMPIQRDQGGRGEGRPMPGHIDGAEYIIEPFVLTLPPGVRGKRRGQLTQRRHCLRRARGSVASWHSMLELQAGRRSLEPL